VRTEEFGGSQIDNTKSRSRFILLLRLCSGVSLLLGISGAVYMLWVRSWVYEFFPSGTSTPYLTYAFLIAFSGFVVFVLFNVFAGMAENLITIREKLSNK
jgi:hypothetical protein